MTIDITPHLAERAAANAPAVVVYSKPACVQCDQTKRLLTREGIEYLEVDIVEDEAAFRYVTQTLQYAQAPVVVVDHPGDMGRSSWAGFRPDLIKDIKVVAA